MASAAAAPPRTRAARQADFDRQIAEKEKRLADGKRDTKETKMHQVIWAAQRKVLEGEIAELQKTARSPTAAKRKWRADNFVEFVWTPTSAKPLPCTLANVMAHAHLRWRAMSMWLKKTGWRVSKSTK